MVQHVQFNDGVISGFIRIPREEIPSPEIVRFGESHTAIMGKNGSGKTTVISQMAVTLFPTLKFRSGSVEKYWSGGLILNPFGARNGIHELVPKTRNTGSKYDNMLHGDYSEAINYGARSFGITMEYSNSYYLSNFVFPDTLSFSHVLNREKLDWEPEWDEELEKELINQNTFCLISHPVPDLSEFDFESKVNPKPLISRVVQISEDTPRAREKRSQIVNFMKYMSENFLPDAQQRMKDVNLQKGTDFSIPEKINYEDLVRAFAYGKSEYIKDASSETGYKEVILAQDLSKNSLLTPFLLPRMLLFDDSFDYQDVSASFAKKVPSVLFEWPRQAFQEHVDYLVGSAVDPHLISTDFKDDLEMLDETINVGYGSGFHKDQFDSDANKESRKARILRANEILKQWRIVPEWTEEYDWQGEARRLIKGSEIHLDGDKISFESGTWASTTPNESTRRWMIRALQVAALESFETPYKILFWDEPELGLHPTAIESIRDRVLPSLEALGMKVVFTTHSMILGNAASKILKCSRNPKNSQVPVLRELPEVNEKFLEELGLSRLDLLSSVSTLLIVEGDHDKIVLETYFGDKLKRERVRILTLGGTYELISLPESEIIMDFLTTKVVILLDGGRRSLLTQGNESKLEELNGYFKINNLTDARTLFNSLRQISGRKAEGKKLFAILELLINRASKDKSLLPRFSFQMLQEDDIIHYLDPNLVLAPVGTKKDWNNLRFEYAAWKKKLDQPNNNEKFLSEKDYYRKYLRAPITKDIVRKASIKLLDAAPPIEFERLGEKLFKANPADGVTGL